MKNVNFYKMNNIHQLSVLRDHTKKIQKEYDKNKKKFDELINSIDSYNGGNVHMNIIYAEVNVILSKSENLLAQLVIIDELIALAHSELVN